MSCCCIFAPAKRMASGMPRYAMMAFCNGICVTSFLGGDAAEVERRGFKLRQPVWYPHCLYLATLVKVWRSQNSGNFRVLESYRKPWIGLKKTTKTESKTSKSLTRYMLELLRCLVSVQAAGRNSSNVCWYSILGMAAWRNHNEGVHTTNSWVQKMWL